MANIIKVFHLELNGEHYYFGSKKALCDAFSKEDIGITYPSLRNYALSPSNPYVNKKKMEFTCDKCNENAVRMTPWAFKGQSFRAEFLCPKCSNRFVGRVSFKKFYDKVVVKHNTAPVP